VFQHLPGNGYLLWHSRTNAATLLVVQAAATAVWQGAAALLDLAASAMAAAAMRM
jgi:hypothetical protein